MPSISMEKGRKNKPQTNADGFFCLFSFSRAKTIILLNAISVFIIAFPHSLRGHTAVVLHVELVLLRHTNSWHMDRITGANLWNKSVGA